MKLELSQDALTSAAVAFLESGGRNRVTAEQALSPAVLGLRLWDHPLFGLSAADDPLYPGLKAPEAVGPWSLTPTEWLPEARTVISFFLPFSQEIQKSNRSHRSLPSEEWLHGRYEGHALLFALCRHLADLLEAEGWKVVIPSLDPRFSYVDEPSTQEGFPPDAAFSSRWSERHAAYISGLGTFGLSKGLITERGICGRFGSLVTDAPPSPPPGPIRDCMTTAPAAAPASAAARWMPSTWSGERTIPFVRNT